MTDRDIARLWSQYVKELAVLLVRAEGSDPPQEVIARMEELVCRELLLLYIRHAAALVALHMLGHDMACSALRSCKIMAVNAIFSPPSSLLCLFQWRLPLGVTSWFLGGCCISRAAMQHPRPQCHA